MTPEDLQRLERKLDMIIDYFHIGQKPPRNIQAEIDKKFIDLTQRKKRLKKEI
jgi:hypothetical protein